MNTQEQSEVKKRFINPVDLEIMEAVIMAICKYFNIQEDDLLSRPVTSEQTNVRRVAFYLIMTNTDLKHWQIADRFLCGRCSVTLSKDIISLHREVYTPTKNLITSIIEIANSFTKKHAWHIH